MSLQLENNKYVIENFSLRKTKIRKFNKFLLSEPSVTDMQPNPKPSFGFGTKIKHYDINSEIFVCPQMVRESLSLFMFLLQVKEKEEAVEGHA